MSAADAPNQNFGLIIAYLVPGFVGLAGATPLFPAVGQWLRPVDQGDLGFGPPVYALLAAIAVGVIVACFRWILLDQFHHWTGLRRPEWDARRLPEARPGVDFLVQANWRYYEATGNMLIALCWAYGVARVTDTLPALGTGTDLGMLVLTLVLLAASRDALARYFNGTGRLLGRAAEKGTEGRRMFNGAHHDEVAGGSSPRKPQESKGHEQPKAADQSKAAPEKDVKPPKK